MILKEENEESEGIRVEREWLKLWIRRNEGEGKE
jgi:hypothetical protein